MLVLRNDEVMSGKFKAVGIYTNGSYIQKRITELYTATLSFLLVVPQATGHIETYIYRVLRQNFFPELLLDFLFIFLFIYGLFNDTSRSLDNTA
jgi:hypothetical protein